MKNWISFIFVNLQFRVSDEKDARGYLQALATKMTEELENLKVMGVSDDSVSIMSSTHISKKLQEMCCFT